MTWAEFKAALEALGVTDDDEIAEFLINDDGPLRMWRNAEGKIEVY
jgi:hypothetical protein